MGVFLATLKNFLMVLSPIFIGFCIAFILSIPVNFFESNLKSISEKYRRATSIIATYIIAIGVLSVILVYLIPSIANSVVKLVEDIQNYANGFGDTLNGIYHRFNIGSDLANQITEFAKNMFMDITKFTVDTMSRVVGITFVVTGAIFRWIIAFFFSLYMLASKESLVLSSKRFFRAILDEKCAERVLTISRRSADIFKNFIGSQFVIAILTGVICFIGMKIFRFPYAELISAIIGFTALIPYFGGFLGPIPSIIIILLVDVHAAVGFTIFIIIMNLLIGNVIVPKIVGDAIGFDGFWVMVAITIGGGLFGFEGMLFGVPVLAIVHSVVSESVDKRLATKYPKGTIF